MAGTKDGRCRRIGRQGALLEIDKNEGGGCNNEKKKKKNGRKNEEREEGGKKGRKRGKGNLFPTFHFQFSARRQELTSFRLLIASILQQTNVKLAVTQFVTETGFY